MQPQPAPTSPEPVEVTVEAELAASQAKSSSRQQFSLLDALLDRKPAEGAAPRLPDQSLTRFLEARDLEEQLTAYVGRVPSPDELNRVRLAVARDISRLDNLLTEQVNAILHHPRFQALESSWRGLWFTVLRAEDGREVIEEAGGRGKIDVRVLNITKRELKKDFERAVEFDQSVMFHRVYEDEFGTAGGTPYGMLVANFSFRNHPDDLDLLNKMSGVAASAFAPLITDAGPDLLSLNDFSSLEQPLDLHATFDQKEYVKWKSLRGHPDSQFLGLTLPRILMRHPYEDDGSSQAGFRFKEDVSNPDRSGYLWGSSAWAFASVVLRAYAASGWFADIRGVRRGRLEGGLVTDLPSHSFGTDKSGVAIRSSTEVALSDNDERALCDLGFIPLSHCQDTDFSVFYSNQSAHAPRGYDDPVATANAKISSMMQYVLCCSRFAHYIKLLARTKIGSVQNAQSLENWLNNWLSEYITPDEHAAPDIKAQYPLRDANCEITEIPSEPGSFRLAMNLLPHYQLDQLAATVRLVARVSPIAK